MLAELSIGILLKLCCHLSNAIVERGPFSCVLSHKNDIRQHYAISYVVSYHIRGTCPVWDENKAATHIPNSSCAHGQEGHRTGNGNRYIPIQHPILKTRLKSFFRSDNDNEHWSSQLSVHTSVTCSECQIAWPLSCHLGRSRPASCYVTLLLKKRRWSAGLLVLWDCVCLLLSWSSGGSVLDYLKKE